MRSVIILCREELITLRSRPCAGTDWKRIIAKHRLGDRFVFNSEFVGSRWDSLSQTHSITFRRVESGETFEVEAEVLISATGALNRPIIPNVPGRDEFKGLQWHSSRWNTEVDLKGKKIAIVGNGSSGIQVIPNIADIEGIEIVQLYVRSEAPSPVQTFMPELPIDAPARSSVYARLVISGRNTTLNTRGFSASSSATSRSPCDCTGGKSFTTTTTLSCRAVRALLRVTCARSFRRQVSLSVPSSSLPSHFGLTRVFEQNVIEYMKKTMPDEYHEALIPKYRESWQSLV